MKPDYYKTEDFAFAAFLKMRNVDLREVISANDGTGKALFVFRMDRADPKLLDLIKEWDSSMLAKELKQYHSATKAVRYALKLYFQSQNAKTF